MGSTAQRPLMLKDYLREDQSFDSRRGFPSAHQGSCDATMRSLLELELREARKRGLVRSRSKGTAFTRISALLNAVRMIATSSSAAPRAPGRGVLQKSLSRRLLAGAFWRRRCPREETKSAAGGKFLIRDVIQLESFVDEARGGRKIVSPPRLTSPLGSSRYSCSCSSCSSRWSEEGSSSEPGSPSSHVPGFSADEDLKKRSSAVPASPAAAAATIADRCAEAKTKEIKENEAGDYPRCHDYEEKEQLSPVSVMDFPYDEEGEEEEEEAETASLSFQQSLASLERTKQELLKKIRRFESLARLVEPVDLDETLSEEDHDGDAATDGQDELGDEEADANTRAKALLDQLKGSCFAGALDREGLGLLLLDFFLEGLRRSGDDAALLATARDWADGTGRKKDAASRESLMAEMEVGGRWRCVNEVDEEVAGDVEAQVLASLVDELVLDMLVC